MIQIYYFKMYFKNCIVHLPSRKDYTNRKKKVQNYSITNSVNEKKI